MRHTQVLLADLRRERQPQCSMLVSERGTGEAHKCHGKFRGTFPMHARYSHIHAWYSPCIARPTCHLAPPQRPCSTSMSMRGCLAHPAGVSRSPSPSSPREAGMASTWSRGHNACSICGCGVRPLWLTPPSTAYGNVDIVLALFAHLSALSPRTISYSIRVVRSA